MFLYDRDDLFSFFPHRIEFLLNFLNKLDHLFFHIHKELFDIRFLKVFFNSFSHIPKLLAFSI